MSETLDKILDLLDVGLQSSSDHGYGTDSAPSLCARCQHNDPAEGGEMCAGCRAFLLGDSEDDPTLTEVAWPTRGFTAREIVGPLPRGTARIRGALLASHTCIGGPAHGEAHVVQGGGNRLVIAPPLPWDWLRYEPLNDYPSAEDLTLRTTTYRREWIYANYAAPPIPVWVHDELTNEQAGRLLR